MPAVKTYQTLILIGGLLGIILVPVLSFALYLGISIGAAFSGESETIGSLADLTLFSIIVSIVLSIISIVLAFAVRNLTAVGGVVLVIGIVMLVVTNLSGIPAWILLIVGGIVALKARNDDPSLDVDLKTPSKKSENVGNQGSREILKDRYARGEITRDEYMTMRMDIEDEETK